MIQDDIPTPALFLVSFQANFFVDLKVAALLLATSKKKQELILLGPIQLVQRLARCYFD